MKKIPHIFVLLSIIVWVNACGNCPEHEPEPLSDINGQCSTDGIDCNDDQSKSFLMSHLEEEKCEENHSKTPAADEEVKPSVPEVEGDSPATEQDPAEEGEAEKEPEEPKTDLEKVCDKYKALVSLEFMTGMNAPEGSFFKQVIEGKLDDFVEEVLEKTLPVVDDEILDEIFNVKDIIDAEFDPIFEKAFRKRNKDQLFEWVLTEGTELGNGYHNCCIEFFNKTESILQKHNLTLDLSKALEKKA